jgi:hypothetical protein
MLDEFKDKGAVGKNSLGRSHKSLPPDFDILTDDVLS